MCRHDWFSADVPQQAISEHREPASGSNARGMSGLGSFPGHDPSLSAWGRFSGTNRLRTSLFQPMPRSTTSPPSESSDDDHWMHLLQRFSHLGSILFPDKVFVTDLKSMNLLIDAGFCKDNIQVGGQPVFESKVKIITNLREDSTNKATIFKKLGLKKNSKMNVFISENMIEP